MIGGRIGERVDPRRLTGAFVVLLSLVAVYTGVSAAVALDGSNVGEAARKLAALQPQAAGDPLCTLPP